MAPAVSTNHAANGTGHHLSGRDHIVVFPFMAKGHTLPLLHFATALSVHQKSIRITMVVTPANVAFASSRLPASVKLAVLPFPSLPPLPSGVESTDTLPDVALYPTFLRATALLREPFAEFLASLPSPPLVLVSDFFLGFTQGVAADAGVRRVVFHGMSCFSMATCKSLFVSPPPSASAEHGASSFHVARMPEHVRITAADVPDTIAKIADLEDPVSRFLVHDIGESDGRSWGVLVNSFAALDEEYVAPLLSFYHGPDASAWLVGPLFLAAEREEEQDPEGCLPWLDEMAAERSESVIYVSFGTQAYVSDEQLDEIARGLVQSGHRFLWAVRSATWSPPVDVAPHGRIIRGWVPQRSVLAHRAVGGFVSHCGWNSVMESLAAGKPVLAWPMMAEQHLNAYHVADILGAGVRIMDVKITGGVVVDSVEVERKVRKLMDAGEEGRQIRERATWAQKSARSAVSDGGTSQVALLRLVEELQETYCDVIVGKKDHGASSIMRMEAHTSMEA